MTTIGQETPQSYYYLPPFECASFFDLFKLSVVLTIDGRVILLHTNDLATIGF